MARGAEEEEAFRGALAELADAEALVGGLRASETPTVREPDPAGARPLSQLAAELLRDLRFAGRTLRKAKGFALAVTLTLGLGIGVNTAAFTLINSLLLDPLPAFDASKLLSLHTVETHAPQGAPVLLPLSFPNLQDVGERGRVFRSLAGFSSVNALTWMNGTSPERLFAELVTANYFETLGVSPRLGRFFLPDEGRAPGAPVLVLGYAPWQHRFGGGFRHRRPQAGPERHRVHGDRHRTRGLPGRHRGVRTRLVDPRCDGRAGPAGPAARRAPRSRSAPVSRRRTPRAGRLSSAGRSRAWR